MTSTKIGRLLALLLALVLVAAACGRDDDGGDAGGGDGGDGEEIASGPGFDGTTIRLGVITPTTGPAAVIGNPLTNGNRVWFDYINEELGGIAGQYPVELVVENNEYVTQRTIEQYNKIKGDVVMFTQILGTPPTNAVLPQLQQDDVVASPASLDSEWVRQQHLLPIGGPYQVQAINAMDYWLREGGGQDSVICVALQDDPYGEAGLEGVEFAASEMGFEVATSVRFSAGNQDFTAQVNSLRGAGCELVFLVALPSDTGTFLGTAAQLGFAPQWIGQSPTWVGALAESPLAPYLEANFWLMSEGTEWGDESVPGMADMLERVERYAPDQGPDIYFTFGYNQANAVTQVLERAVEMGDLSREGIIAAMNDIDRLEFDGLIGDYEWGPPEDRNPPRASTVFKVNPERPFGLETLSEVNFSSEAAQAFTFEE